MSNKFAAALKSTKAPAEAPAVDSAPSAAAAKRPPSRRTAKHIGGYFDPAVSRQLKEIALAEDSSVQSLVAEALDMLFQSRRKPTIAQKQSKK